MAPRLSPGCAALRLWPSAGSEVQISTPTKMKTIRVGLRRHHKARHGFSLPQSSFDWCRAFDVTSVDLVTESGDVIAFWFIIPAEHL
jgi:hypothetical protein